MSKYLIFKLPHTAETYRQYQDGVGCKIHAEIGFVYETTEIKIWVQDNSLASKWPDTMDTGRGFVSYVQGSADEWKSMDQFKKEWNDLRTEKSILVNKEKVITFLPSGDDSQFMSNYVLDHLRDSNIILKSVSGDGSVMTVVYFDDWNLYDNNRRYRLHEGDKITFQINKGYQKIGKLATELREAKRKIEEQNKADQCSIM